MTIPTITTVVPALPTAPQRSDPATFESRSDAWLDAVETELQPSLNALVTEINAASVGIDAVVSSIDANANAVQLDRTLVVAAKAAVDAQSPVANAAAAAASALAAAASATLAQATNPDAPIRLNPRAITATTVIASAYNAQSTGPLRIADGITVTVQDNATWSIC